MFFKLRLSFLVVFSAAITYAISFLENKTPNGQFDWAKLGWVVLGGFLVTGASNGFNQIWEKDSDKLMTRTLNRPLPQDRMKMSEAMILSFLVGGIGVNIIWNFLNPLTGILGIVSLLSYALIYTPLKKITPWAVFVGAFPGAMPPMIGWVAFTGELGPEALSLFALQFIWQFPHFWAIAWRCFDDYAKAGFYLLPSKGGKNKQSAAQILIYTLFMIPISLLPTLNIFGEVAGVFSSIIIILSGFIMLYPAYKLFVTLSDKWATKLMFASFIYLPLILITLLVEQLLSK